MTVLSVPAVGSVYRHRLFEHQPVNPDYCDAEVIGVATRGERLHVVAAYLGHRAGRREVFVLPLEQFRSTYPTLREGKP